MKEITLKRGLVALVDDDDYEKLAKFKWRVSSAGYACRTRAHEDGRRYEERMHRAIMGLSRSDGLHIDHIDGNRLNNTRSNLRTCSRTENNRNIKKHRDNTSGYKGVIWAKWANKWRAQIRVNKKPKYLGYFDSAELAYQAYKAAAIVLHGEFANIE